MGSGRFITNGLIKEKKKKRIINIDLAIVASQWFKVVVYDISGSTSSLHYQQGRVLVKTLNH